MSIRLKIQILLLAILLLALTNAFFVLKTEENAKINFDWISHRDEVFKESQSLLENICYADSSQLSYILTLDEAYLLEYSKAVEKTKKSLNRLSQMHSDKYQQLDNLKIIKSLIVKKTLLSEHTIDLTKQGKIDEAINIIKNKKAKSIMDDIHNKIIKLKDIENTLLNNYQNEFKNNQKLLKFYIALETLGLIILSIFAWFVLKIILIKPLEQLLIFTQKVENIDKHPDDYIQNNTTTFKLNEIDEIKTLSQKFDNLQKRLLEQNALISSVIDSSADIIFYKDYSSSNGAFIGCNEAFCRYVGKSKNQIIGKTGFELFNTYTAEVSLIEDKKVIELNKPNINEEWVKYPDGTNVLFETLKTPLYNHDKSILGVLGVTRDITEKHIAQKELEDQNEVIFEQSKLASMGEMIGNIAHQWRQPLSAISTGVIDLKLGKELDTLSDEEFYKTCDSIDDNAQYLSKTINDFTDFIKGNRKKVEFKVKDNINSFLHLVEGTIKNNNIYIEKNIKDDITISGYPNELIQCLINIFNNAKDAFQNNKNKKYIFIDVAKNEKNLIIKIKDNAGGIPQETLPKIFEPYFTTKHQSQGTGLGLSMSYRLIVEGMNGTIKAVNVDYEYENVHYKGAEFTIKVPLS